MNRILIAVTVATLSLAPLTACGGEAADSARGESYCADLKSAKQQVDALKDGDFSALAKTTEVMHQLADEAPDEIKGDWESLVASVDQLVALLEGAGLSDQDMASLQSGQIPDGADMKALQQLMSELQALNTTEFQQASDNIDQHAQDECGLDLQP